MKYPFLIISAFCFTANAQISNQNITIERDYTPVIQDAGKISSVPEVIQNEEPKEAAVYSDFDFPLPVSQNIHTLSAAKAYTAPTLYGRDAYLRVGLGNYFNNLLDFALPILKNPDYHLDFGINHLAAFGKRIHSDSKAELNFDKNFKDFTLFAGAGGGYEFFNYYGNSYFRDSAFFDNETFNNKNESLVRFNAFAGVRSMPDAENWRYNGRLKFNLLRAQNGLTERAISAPVSLGFYYKDHRVGIDFTFNYLLYNKTADSAFIYEPNAYSPSIINPYYQYTSEKFKARLGATLGVSIGGAGQYGQLFTVAPDVYAEFAAVPSWLALYGGIGGGLDVNTLDKTYSENRYLFPALRLADTYTPINAYAGIKLKPFYNVLFDAFANYRYIENQYFFVNGYFGNMFPLTTNRFVADYSRASLFKFGARLGVNFNEIVDIQAKAAYNKWFTYQIEQAWQMPAFEADFSASVHPTRDITISANAFYRSERTAKLQNSIITMQPVIDINIGGSYAYANWLSFFVKANNLLNSKYEEYLGYQVQGLNVLLGATLSF